jgi:hypothetical protein
MAVQLANHLNHHGQVSWPSWRRQAVPATTDIIPLHQRASYAVACGDLTRNLSHLQNSSTASSGKGISTAADLPSPHSQRPGVDHTAT